MSPLADPTNPVPYVVAAWSIGGGLIAGAIFTLFWQRHHLLMKIAVLRAYDQKEESGAKQHDQT